MDLRVKLFLLFSLALFIVVVAIVLWNSKTPPLSTGRSIEELEDNTINDFIDPCKEEECTDREVDFKDNTKGKNPFLKSRFSASTLVKLKEGEEKVLQLDFVFPDSQFPIGNLRYFKVRPKKTTMIPFYRCEAKWKNRDHLAGNFKWDNIDGTHDWPWLDLYEKWSGGRFKWSKAEFHSIDMNLDLTSDLEKKPLRQPAWDNAKNKLQEECPQPGDGVTNIVYRMQYPTTGGRGYAHTAQVVEHEAGHALGLFHAMGLKPATNSLLSTKISKYNTFNSYGAWNCIMGNSFSGTMPGFCAGTMWIVGWLPESHFVFVKHGQTYKIRNQMNWSGNLPLALCFRDPYTGVAMMLEYAGKDNKSIFKNSEFVWTDPENNKEYNRGFILSAVNDSVVQLVPYTSKSFQTPYGWHFNVIEHDQNEAVLKATYKPETITYKPAQIMVSSKSTGSGKLRVTIKLCDFSSSGNDINNPPRAYNWSKCVLLDTNGKEYAGEVNGDFRVLPSFVGADKNDAWDGYGMLKSRLDTIDDFPRSGFLTKVFDVENPGKTAGIAQFQFVVNRDHHCMVKVLNLEFL